MKVIAVESDPIALTLTLVAEFEAPLERVWQVWADPRQLERWWGPPGYPATVVDHDLTAGGRVTYYMTAPGGEQYPGWWRIVAVDPPHALDFEDRCGPSNDPLPTTSVEVRLIETSANATMTITCRFASTADMEQRLGTGMAEGLRSAVEQIEPILTEQRGAS